LQPWEGGKPRTCVEPENTLAHLLGPEGVPISVHGSERQRFQNKHVQSALDEITRLVRHRLIPPEDQEEEEYTSPTDCQEERTAELITNVWHQKKFVLRLRREGWPFMETAGQSWQRGHQLVPAISERNEITG
jgi:hypothetical protein